MGDIFYQVAMVAPPPFQSLVAAAEPFMPPAPNVNETDQVDPTNDSGDPTAADTMKGNSTEIEESMSAQEEMAWMAVTTTCLVCSGPAYMNLTEQCNDVFSLFLKARDTPCCSLLVESLSPCACLGGCAVLQRNRPSPHRLWSGRDLENFGMLVAL